MHILQSSFTDREWLYIADRLARCLAEEFGLAVRFPPTRTFQLTAQEASVLTRKLHAGDGAIRAVRTA